MKLRKECEHGKYEEHPCIDGKWVSQARMLRISGEDRPRLTLCPGGVFLPDDTLIIQKVDGEWPQWATSTRTAKSVIMSDGQPSLFFLTMPEILDALSVREAE